MEQIHFAKASCQEGEKRSKKRWEDEGGVRGARNEKKSTERGVKSRDVRAQGGKEWKMGGETLISRLPSGHWEAFARARRKQPQDGDAVVRVTALEEAVNPVGGRVMFDLRGSP